MVLKDSDGHEVAHFRHGYHIRFHQFTFAIASIEAFRAGPTCLTAASSALATSLLESAPIVARSWALSVTAEHSAAAYVPQAACRSLARPTSARATAFRSAVSASAIDFVDVSNGPQLLLRTLEAPQDARSASSNLVVAVASSSSVIASKRSRC